MPTEIFFRCADVNENGWLTARTANISVLDNDRRRVQCISGTEQPIYRRIETLPPFVQPSVTESNLGEIAAVYSLPLTMEVHYDEGPFQFFPPWPHVQFEPNERVVQVKKVTVRNQSNMECFQWRAIIQTAPKRSWDSELYRIRSFVCQNVTGNMVDFYTVDTKDVATNTTIISTHAGDDALVSKVNTSEPVFTFLATFEFQERMWVNGGVIARQFSAPIVGTSSFFDLAIRMSLYTEATNVSVNIPGEEMTRTALDAVVIIVGLTEVIIVLLLGLIITVYSRFKWTKMQTVNTVDGLSQCWGQCNAGNKIPEAKRSGRITLRLRKRTCDESVLFAPLGPEETVDEGGVGSSSSFDSKDAV
ncbi:hypothetical protein FGB62_79g040 [Gracilaria domingensis]|nr:hypothetical protein FGB62_79g040 [Gracilaria domingensis]